MGAAPQHATDDEQMLTPLHAGSVDNHVFINKRSEAKEAKKQLKLSEPRHLVEIQPARLPKVTNKIGTLPVLHHNILWEVVSQIANTIFKKSTTALPLMCFDFVYASHRDEDIFPGLR
ncbi:hypothetical protein LSAT2_007598 [Lamellibrachia satsuma]|nr:hypothetical protein LSAT2_007598 [Lamellibrachia satsuma]